MPLDPPASLVNAIRDCRILDSARFEELVSQLHPRFPEPRALARELVLRGWLTPFQAAHLVQGKGQDLLLGPYLILERLGEGGMGRVFKARHLLMNRLVALKVIRKGNLAEAEVLSRFHREVQASAQLSHPNIVLAHDAAHIGENHFLVMEYVDGINLSKLVKKEG